MRHQAKLKGMKEAGRIVGLTRQYLEKLVVPGIETGELDKRAGEFIAKEGGRALHLAGRRGLKGGIRLQSFGGPDDLAIRGSRVRWEQLQIVNPGGHIHHRGHWPFVQVKGQGRPPGR